MITLCRFTVYGRPEVKGRMTAFVPQDRSGQPIRRAGGSIVVNVTDSGGAKLKAWERSIAQAAGTAYEGELLREVPIKVSILFHFSRLKSHFGTGRRAGLLKPSAPVFHLGGSRRGGDIDKLTRAVLDGMTNVIYQDDGQVCELDVQRKWTVDQERAQVIVRRLDE